MGDELDTQISSKRIFIGISVLFVFIIIYPWMIVVTILSFIIGFTCLERLDKFVKSSISSKRFGARIQLYFKDYIYESDGSSNTSLIKTVTADPLHEYLEESQNKVLDHKTPTHTHQEELVKHEVPPTPTLKIPSKSFSNKSSPEKHKPFESTKSLSASSSRRVSEDVASLKSGSGNLSNSPGRGRKSKTPSPSKSSTAASTPSPTFALNADIAALRLDQDFRVNARVDKALGRCCRSILDYYISSSWAPYETRRQLKLSFKQLLTSFAEAINKKLICSEVNSPEKLTREKLIPLFLFYFDKTLQRGASDNDAPILSPESRIRAVLKIKKFCRQIFETVLTKDNLNCKLWMELCISVLGDGVLVNVMNLGKDKLPEVLQNFITTFVNSCKQRRANESQKRNSQEFMDAISSNPQITENCESKKCSSHSCDDDLCKESKKVPFLLDSFLDPPNNFEKPDQIVSRWRPTLKDIVSETDLLYPLIQYMKIVGGQQSLAYLQGVLDDLSGEGDPYCKRMLELEYLPGFCRSSLLLETMGLSRVEMAMEVGTDVMSTRRNSNGHTRSASYGGPSTSSFREFLRIEQGVVDGLPLSESSSAINPTTSEQHAATLPGAGAIEPSLAFKRRPHLEMYIAKFMKSTTKSWKQFYDPLADRCELAKREGIDAKSYDDWDHEEVNSRVRIDATTADIYDSMQQSALKLLKDSPIATPFLSGLASFLKPYLMPTFNTQLESALKEILSEDLLVYVVDAISNVFEEPCEATVNDENHQESTMGNSVSDSSSTNISASHQTNDGTTSDNTVKSSIQSFLSNLLRSVALNMFDLDLLVKSCSKNRDYIFLFFVDVLDILVSEIVEKND